MPAEANLSKPYMRPAEWGDIAHIAPAMRLEDAAEVLHSSLKSPYGALHESLWASWEARTVVWWGRPIAMFGVSGGPSQGSPWMLATDDLKAIRKTFLRECHAVVEGWLRHYEVLANAVWSKNHAHIQWLKWMGFIFEGSEVRNGETFLHFYRIANV